MILRPYQSELAEQAAAILAAKNLVYLAMEMRVGKTLIALETARLSGAKRVLFATKKKAISSVEKDFLDGGFAFEIVITNYENLHNVTGRFDLVIADEAHCFGAFPRPSGRTKMLKSIVGNAPLILLSGTPSPESYSQLFHQFWLSAVSPFREYRNFYSWAKKYVTVTEKRLGSHTIRDYSDANRAAIMAICGGLFLHYTQADAGFEQAEVREIVRTVEQDKRVNTLIDTLLKARYYRFQDGAEIVCDTPAKLMNKIHQLSSGTVKTETGETKILVTNKCEFIKANYSHLKIAVFYKFIAEGNALRAAFQNATDDPAEFARRDDAVFVCQIQSGAMGINLATADVLIMYNIDFSAQLYFQARARLSDKNRAAQPEVHWLFSEGGIEAKIYKAVSKKKDYTAQYFRKDFLKNNFTMF